MSARRQIVAALSEDSLGGIATLQDVERAEQLANAHRAEVLAEAKREVVAWLVKKAREGTPIERLADKVERGAIGVFLNAEREEATASAATATPTPDFFRPGVSYRNGLYTFHCHGLGPHPGSRETRASGWLTHQDRGPEVWSMDPDDWTHGGWNRAEVVTDR